MLPVRGIVLAVALAATIVASLFDVSALDAVEPQTAGVAAAATAAPAPPKPLIAEVAQPLRAPFESQAADLFAVRSWQPPPPPPRKAEAPKAPPLPFRYLGKVLDDAEIMVFLEQSARTHLVRKGDLLADYKVDEITTSGMTFVYVPLNEKQSLTFGSAN
ncbi:hypothetical protein [Rhodoferax sp.]|uniref:hypothetical protein n=1 Tax=Rhodoferax sp. TaxID=50421 RepID=UPI00271F0ADE|nr:hypothetical protein [Rhodoferax sp.]MDO9197001.1 hypothetical protein [Rhodoferax sp.]